MFYDKNNYKLKIFYYQIYKKYLYLLKLLTVEKYHPIIKSS